MKKMMRRIAICLLALLICISFAACDNGNTGGKLPGITNGNNMRRDNDFEDDGIYRRFEFSDYDNYDDSGFDKDTGVLVDHIYEAETMATVGNSSDGVTNFGHLCVGKSFQFDPAFSGNIAVKNYTNIALKLTVNSDKSMRVPVEMRISNQRGADIPLAGDLLSGYFMITNTYGGKRHAVRLFDTVIPEGGEQITSNEFFHMVTVSFEMDISEGLNEILIQVASVPTNMDYFNIKTSANLSDNQTAVNWFDDERNVVQITKVPTETEKGTIRFECQEGHGSANFATLPELTSKVYEKVNEEGVDTYYLTVSGERIKVAPFIPEFVENGDGKINLGSGGLNLYDNQGVYPVGGGYSGLHWKQSIGGGDIDGEKATVFTFGSVSSVTIDTDSTGNSKTGGFFRAMTVYSRDNAVGEHYSYEFTFTFRNYGDKSLQFETYFRYGSNDTKIKDSDVTTVNLAPAGESGDTATVVIEWTDTKDGTDGNMLTYFRNFVYGGTPINTTESLELLNGVSFAAYAFVKNLGVIKQETPEIGTKLNFGQGMQRYDNNGSYTAGNYTGNHFSTNLDGAQINGESATLISFGEVSNVSVINDNSDGYSKTGAFFRLLSPLARSGNDTYTFTMTFANYSDKSLEFEVYFRHSGNDSVINDGDITKITLAPKGQSGDTVTVTVTWTDKKGSSDGNLLTYFRNFAVGGVAIDSAAALEHLQGVSFGALLYGKKN